MGSVSVDDLSRPRVALVDLDFILLAGDPEAATAETAVRGLGRPANLAPSRAEWAPLLRRVWGDAVRPYTRVAFRPGDWDRSRLRAFIDALPSRFELKRIDVESAPRLAKLADSLVYNFPSLDDLVARGAAFGIEHEGRFVSGCSSFAISSRSLEFEIQTHAEFRRRGLASAAAAAMIEYCLDRGLEPCWDAHNDNSAALAAKLGFTDPTSYTAYAIGRQSGESGRCSQ